MLTMLDKYRYVSLLIFISTIFDYNESKKTSKNIYFLSTQVSFDPLYLQDHVLIEGKDHTSLDIILNVAQNFTSDPWVEIMLATKNRKTDSYKNLFTYDINVCQILGKEGSQLNNFVSPWVNNFWKYGNLPKSCPIIRGNYTWNGLKADKLNIPSFLPGGKYRAIINTYFRRDTFKDSVANLTIFVELK